MREYDKTNIGSGEVGGGMSSGEDRHERSINLWEKTSQEGGGNEKRKEKEKKRKKKKNQI